MVPWSQSELMTIKVGLIDLLSTGSHIRDLLVWARGQIGSLEVSADTESETGPLSN